jgi:endonuclease III
VYPACGLAKTGAGRADPAAVGAALSRNADPAGPDPAAKAALPEATILGQIRQLGLARTKARHLKRLAQRWGLSSGESVYPNRRRPILTSKA